MLHGLGLDEDAATDDDVETVAAGHEDALVRNRQVPLPLERKASQSKLAAKARLVGRFEQTGPQVLVYSMSAPKTTSVSSQSFLLPR
jgi:hypothetical protein